MANPAQHPSNAISGKRNITIKPIYEEITGGDVSVTGRYLLKENNTRLGEVRFAGESKGWLWDGNRGMVYNNISEIIRFILDYKKPEYA